MPAREGAFRSLEARTAALFLAAGCLFAVFAALHGVEAVVDRSAPKDVFGPAGFALSFVGMLGLYPTLVDRSPKLARAGAVFATIGAVAAAVTSAWHVGLWVVPATTPAYVTAFAVGMVIGQFPGYLSFGVAALRSGGYSRSVGLLLVAVPVVLAVMMVTVATGFATSGSAVVLGSVQALIHLAIGATLRTERVSTDHAGPSAEPAAE